MAEHGGPSGMPDTIDLGARVVPGGYFAFRRDAPRRTSFSPSGADGGDAYQHCFTYAGGGTIRHKLIEMIDGARQKIFVATLYLGDAEVRKALTRAAERLRGGVYVLAALDNKGLDKAINETDDITDEDKQTEYRNFKVITKQGIYVRGYPGLHAKYVVVDDKIALVSSANLVTRAFECTGENGVVVTARADVHALATLFARLWEHSTFDLPPSRDRSTVKQRNPGRGMRLPTVTGNGPIWTVQESGNLSATLREVVDGARRELVLATFSLLGIAHPFSHDKPARPELLLDPVRAAVERGVDVRLILRGRNIGDGTRREAAAFADAGVRIVPDRLNHAKGVIADGTRGALFSANFVPHMGLSGGVETGMRLDGTSALAEAHRYFAHVQAEADLEFVRETTSADLAARLYAESFTTWPHQALLDLVVDPTDWAELSASTDFALYEAEADERTTLYVGRRKWQLTRHDNRWLVDRASGASQVVPNVLEKWLAPSYKSGIPHGFCSATLRRAEWRGSSEATRS